MTLYPTPGDDDNRPLIDLGTAINLYVTEASTYTTLTADILLVGDEYS